MHSRCLRLASPLFLKNYKQNILRFSKRNVQISVIGAANDVGSNVAMLLKVNSKVTNLLLYDDDDRVRGIGMELSQIPGGPAVSVYSGDANLGDSISRSHIILMTSRAPRKPGNTREEMIAANAPAILHVCKAMLDHNPYAFLAISTNPLNSIIPFASALLSKFGCYNPYKVLGITHIDTARSRALVGNALQINPRNLHVPVIGGHSEDTIIPLFSNINPPCCRLDPCQADTLTRLVRKAGTEVMLQKRGTDSATLAMAWSIHEFVDGLIDAVYGSQVVLNCYTANPAFGTRYFSGPTNIGYGGILQTCYGLPMNEHESSLLDAAVCTINRDVEQGEEYGRYIVGLGKF